MLRSDSTAALEETFESIVATPPASRHSSDEDDFVDINGQTPASTRGNATFVVREAGVAELLAAMQERMCELIIKTHNETCMEIIALEQRMEERIKEAVGEITKADKKRAKEAKALLAVKKEAKETKEALLARLETQIGELKQQTATMVEKERSTKKRVDAAKKGALECFESVKSRCMKPFNKNSIGVDTTSDSTPLQALTLSKKGYRVEFRNEGTAESRRWFVSGVKEPAPCALKVGDEIVTIGGAAVSGASLERLQEMVGTLAHKGTIQVRRSGDEKEEEKKEEEKPQA